ncbi:MAG: apolipoprotein N-acyltransferase [Chakrabartia sp.]
MRPSRFSSLFVQRFPLTFAFLAGLVSATGFAPLGLWPLTLIALALLAQLIWTAPSVKAALARGHVFGFGQFFLGLNWIAGTFVYQSAMPVWLGWGAVAALSLYLALYPALATGLAFWGGRHRSKTGFALLLAATWIVAEVLRATLFTGFAWNPLAATVTGAAHATAFVGTYGVSGVVMALGGGLWLIARRQWRAGGAITGVAASALLLAPGGPVFTARQDAAATGPLLRVVQPNIGQQNKHDPAFDAINFLKLEEMTGAPGKTPRLVLWPEAAVPDYLEEDTGARLRLASLLGPKDMLLTGGVALEYDAKGQLAGARNSVFALTPDGRLTGRYDKAHLVPYGEYLPMRPVLSAIGLSRLVPGDIDFWPGPGPRTLVVPGFGRIGMQVCYEIVFSGHVVDRANRPNFIFNPSNDAWFGSWGPPQQLAQARLRAMEEGLPVIRSTPTGISAIIDANGRVQHALPYQKAGAIEARLPPALPPTLFARFGTILSIAFAALLALLGIAQRRALR